jgi:hypothetical protein
VSLVILHKGVGEVKTIVVIRHLARQEIRCVVEAPVVCIWGLVVPLPKVVESAHCMGVLCIDGVVRL